MSVQAITWALDQACTTATEKAILLVLANYVGADGQCYPGQETIAQQACCSIKSVERALAVFEGHGWIARSARRRRDGSRTSDLIEFTATASPERKENNQPDRKSGSQPTRHPVGANPTPCPNQPDTLSGLTSFEPLEEPLEAVVEGAAASVRSDDWPEGKAIDHAAMLVIEVATVFLDPSRQMLLVTTTGRLDAWRKAGASWEHDVVPIVTALARKARNPIASWKFFDAAIAQSVADNAAALEIPAASLRNDPQRPDRHTAQLGHIHRIFAAMGSTDDGTVERGGEDRGYSRDEGRLRSLPPAA